MLFLTDKKRQSFSGIAHGGERGTRIAELRYEMTKYVSTETVAGGVNFSMFFLNVLV